MQKTSLNCIHCHNAIDKLKVTDKFSVIENPKEGEYYLYGNNLLKIVSANSCERCFFYPNGYCKLMFLQNGNIHCDYNSHINFLFLKKIIHGKS